MDELLYWDIYEITTKNSPIHGVMLRGRLRKLALDHSCTLLVENASDKENCVRFAVFAGESPTYLITYLEGILDDVDVTLCKSNLANPVLSKLKVNLEERYTL